MRVAVASIPLQKACIFLIKVPHDPSRLPGELHVDLNEVKELGEFAFLGVRAFDERVRACVINRNFKKYRPPSPPVHMGVGVGRARTDASALVRAIFQQSS